MVQHFTFIGHTLSVVFFRVDGFMATVLGKNEPIFKVWLSFRGAGKSQSSPLGKLVLIKATGSLSRVPPSVSVFKCKAE